MNDRERKSGNVPAVTSSTERREVTVVRQPSGSTRQVRSTFHFDHVLTPFSTQREVFAATLQPLVRDVLNGYEACAFAYGQTGTGKTYTMEGELDSEASRGLVPRTAAAVFEALYAGPYIEREVLVSCLEIYNEDLSDLLVQSHTQKLDLKETHQGVRCFGLSEVPVSAVSEVIDLIQRAQERRRVAETRINARSSRSHCIFSLKVRCRQRVMEGELENVGKLHLVDLAGSECAKKAALAALDPSKGCQRDEEHERRSINQSLLTLGRVIAALRDGDGMRVPYRDSKLTRLLQSALGGHCRTVVIATISPSQSAADETISTLTYADQASGIKNRPEAMSLLSTTRAPTPNGSSADLRTPTALGDGTGGKSFDEWAELEMRVSYLNHEIEEAKSALARKFREVHELNERLDSSETERAACATQLEEAQQLVLEKTYVLAKTAEFADRQTSETRRFAEELFGVGAQNDALATQLEKRRAWVVAVKGQVRNLFAEAASRGAQHAALATAMAEAATDATEEMAKAAKAIATGARDDAEKQQELLSSLVSAVRDGSACQQELLADAVRKACLAASVDQATTAERVEAIRASVRDVATVIAGGSEAIEEALSKGEATHGECVEAFRAQLRMGIEALQAAAGSAGAAVAAASGAVTAAQERSDTRLANGGLLGQLGDLKHALQVGVEEIEAHMESLVQESAQTEKDVASAGTRRELLGKAIRSAIAAHSAAAAEKLPPLARTLELLADSAARRSSSAASSGASVATDLEVAESTLRESSKQAEILADVQFADKLLTDAWSESQPMLTGLRDAMEDAAARGRAESAAAELQQGATAADEALLSSVSSAVVTLAGVRSSMAAEVEELQKQRTAEEEIVEHLCKQREALRKDIADAEESLLGVRAELENATSALGAVQEEQAVAREQALRTAMDGFEALLRGELEGLGRKLSDGVEPVVGSIHSATKRACITSAVVNAAENKSAEEVNKLAGTVATWAAGVDGSCAAIAAARDRGAEAAEGVQAAAALASEQLKQLGLTAAQWGASCEDLAAVADAATDTVCNIRSAQDALYPRWFTAKNSMEAAVEAWVEGNHTVVEDVVRLQANAKDTAKEATRLGDEVAEHCAAARGHLKAGEDLDAKHLDVLQELAAQQANHCQEDAASEARRVEAGAALVDKVRMLAGRASSHVAGAAETSTTATTHRAASAADAEVIIGMLAGVEASTQKLALDCGLTLSGSMDATASLQEAASDAAKDARQAVTGCARAVDTAAGTAGTHAEEHSAVLLAAGANADLRWAELQSNFKKAIGVVETAAQQVDAAAEAQAGGAMVRHMGAVERCDAAAAATKDALERTANGHARGLRDQQMLWVEGLAVAPMKAQPGCQAEENSDDEVGSDIGTGVGPLGRRPAAISPGTIPGRPCEQTLATEFRAGHRPASLQSSRGPTMEVRQRHPTPSAKERKPTPPRKGLPVEGPPRGILREVQVGAGGELGV